MENTEITYKTIKNAYNYMKNSFTIKNDNKIELGADVNPELKFTENIKEFINNEDRIIRFVLKIVVFGTEIEIYKQYVRYLLKLIAIDEGVNKFFIDRYIKEISILDENDKICYINFPVDFILEFKKVIDDEMLIYFLSKYDILIDNIINNNDIIEFVTLIPTIYNNLKKCINKYGTGCKISDKLEVILNKLENYVNYFPKKDIDKSYVDYYFKSFLDLGNNITYDNTKLIDFKLKDYFNDMITTIKEENKITKQSLEVKIITIKDIEKDDYVYLAGDEVPIIDILNMPLISFDYIIPKYKDIVISKENYICLVNALNKHAYKFIYDNLNNQDKDLLKNMFSNNRSSLNEPVVQIGKNVNKIEKLIVEINKLLGKDYMYDGKNKDKLLLNLFDCYKNNEDILYRLIFIYFVMYEKKGMNMRNKCTHGYYFNKCCFFEEVCTFICLNELEVIKKGCIK